MPIVTSKTERYQVSHLTLGENGEMECVECFKAASFKHIAELDNHRHPVHWYRNNCQYQQLDGSWKGRSVRSRHPRLLIIRRIGFVQTGVPLRGGAAAHA